MKVVLISGKAQHGKDTVSNILRNKLTSDGKNVLVAHYADLVKYVCQTYFGWNGIKDEYGRHLLQYVGTDVIRKQAPDFWVYFVKSMLKFFDGEWDYVLIPDTRFVNEIDVMKSEFGAVNLRVVRPNFVSPLTEEQQNHSSETALDGYEPDYVILNSGSIEELTTAVLDWLKEYQKMCSDKVEDDVDDGQIRIEGF